jgi:hypothetical protein
MAQDDREKPSVRTTIVGGRPPGSGKALDTVPRGMEILLKKAAVDESFRKLLLSDRLNAADAIGLTLNPVEVAMLKAIPASGLERMVAATKVQPKIRHAFMGYAATVMLAALTAASDGMSQDLAQASRGIQPDAIQDDKPVMIAGLMTTVEMKERLAEQYKSESYMRIASRDQNAPRGNIEVTIDNWASGLSNVFKIHLTKIEASAPSGNDRTEGLGYAFIGQFLEENIPIGEYLVEIGFADKVYVRSKKVTVKSEETAKVSFKVKFRNPNDSLAPGQFATDGILIDIE